MPQGHYLPLRLPLTLEKKQIFFKHLTLILLKPRSWDRVLFLEIKEKKLHTPPNILFLRDELSINTGFML